MEPFPSGRMDGRIGVEAGLSETFVTSTNLNLTSVLHSGQKNLVFEGLKGQYLLRYEDDTFISHHLSSGG